MSLAADVEPRFLRSPLVQEQLLLPRGSLPPGGAGRDRHQLGIEALALTDRDGVYGIVRAHVQARELGVALVPGAEVTLDDGSTIVLLAQDRDGYANLCRLITDGRLRSPKGRSQVGWHEVCAHAEGLIALWGGDAEPPRGERRAGPHRAPSCARPSATGSTRWSRAIARAEEVAAGGPPPPARRALRAPARRRRARCSTTRRRAARCRTCSPASATASRSPPPAGASAPNAEHALQAPAAFARALRRRSRRRRAHARGRRALHLLARPSSATATPRSGCPTARRPRSGSRELTFAGAPRALRRRRSPPTCRRTAREGAATSSTSSTTAATSSPCGRSSASAASAASSARAAARRRTPRSATASASPPSIPVRMDLLFERFLSRERAEPPDIDLDIEHERREEVIQHVYAKYGRDHAAMVANVIRYRARSAVRDVGKALGIPETALDRLAKLLSALRRDRARRARRRPGSTPTRPRTGTCCGWRARSCDFPRHLSIHPGGFLLGPRAGDTTSCPIENATMPDRTVIQWDKDDLEDAGPLQGRPARPRRAHPARTAPSTCIAAAPRASTCSMADDPAGRPGDLRHDLRAPTRSASSRSRAARRWPCCRA